MLKKTITYHDYNGVERTEDFYFNLTEADILELAMGVEGGFVEMVDRIIAAQDNVTLIKIFKDIILKSYGVKSPDGRRHMKTDALREEFSQTEAYSILFVELASDADAAAKFINGIAPVAKKPSIPAPPIN